ncbi:MAG TPA: zinc ribbon domain-containing protein [Bacillota bacterium]|nr:zinc ribbon domain-containing protein [Bacillota bacterium]
MKSVKPGRGPSMMGAFGSAAAAVFGVIWTLVAVNMGAGPLFACFGIIFVIMGIVQAVYNYKNATGKNRFSSFDITDSAEESDPLDEYFAERKSGNPGAAARDHRSGNSEDAAKDERPVSFCPYCGAEVEGDFTYCAKCGKKLPD